MATDLIRYDLLVQDALRSVMRKVLAEAARDGLPGNHHFVIAFRTQAPGVRLSQSLREKFPQELTIVLQHQFWNLTVTEQAFEVGLSFDGKSETLVVPFNAVTGFFDPAVEFGLKFEPAEEPTPAGQEAPKPLLDKPLLDVAQPTALRQPPVARSLAEKAKPRGSGSEPAEVAPVLAPAEAAKSAKTPPGKSGEAPKADTPANVVSIESFRKKP